MPSLFRRKKLNTENDQSSSCTGSTISSRSEIEKGSVETTVFRVKIPPNVNPGDEFQVYGKRVCCTIGISNHFMRKECVVFSLICNIA